MAGLTQAGGVGFMVGLMARPVMQETVHVNQVRHAASCLNDEMTGTMEAAMFW